MMNRFAAWLSAVALASLTCAIAPGAWAASTPVETRVAIHYKITMIGVSIGQILWTIDLSGKSYQASASGKASGALSMLVNGEGRVATQGTIEGEKVSPAFFSSNVTEDGEITGLQMTFENGGIKTLRLDRRPEKSGRIPVGEADQRGVTDPLSGMLIVAPPGEPQLAPERCDRVVPVFDGQRRYDLNLTFKRMDRLKMERGYAGPVLVCAVVLNPIAGYRPDSLLVKYVGGRQGMEIWFVPVDGTAMIAPGRLVMPTGLGTLQIDGDRFEMLAVRPPGAPAPGPVAPR